MVWMMFAMMAMTAYSGYMSSEAQKDQAGTTIGQGMYNKVMSEYRAEMIREQSIDQADNVIAAGERLRQKQVVAQAASGVVIGEGSAAAVTEQTQELAAQDALTVLYSGIEGQISEIQAGKMNLQASMAAGRSGLQAADATLISTGASMMGQYYAGSQMKAKK